MPINEFVGLRSNDKYIKKCKGVAKDVVKKSMTLDDYKNTLYNSPQMEHTMKAIELLDLTIIK